MSPLKKNHRLVCPCFSGEPYIECCQLLHEGQAAANAEQLMRSRYTAYVLMLEGYLLETWHPGTRPTALSLDESSGMKWLGLEIMRFESHSANSATVEFIARYKIGGEKAERLHEISQFELLDRWYYVSGIIE